jgi:hypothetical protein
LANAAGPRREEAQQHRSGSPLLPARLAECGGIGELGDSQEHGHEGRSVCPDGESPQRIAQAGFWSDCEWIPCIDGKSRPTKSLLFPLATGITNRVGLLRGAGNALCAPQAIAFIESYLEIKKGRVQSS